MRDKSKFTRQTVHDKKMRLVKVRLDYRCDCELKTIRSLFDDAFKKSFSNEPEIFEYHDIHDINLSNEELVSISRNLDISVDEIKELPFIRYSGFKRGKCHAFIDISQCYMCLTIKCENNYDGLADYVEPIKGAFTIFQNKGFELKPRRFGIRKIRIEDFVRLDDLETVFEPFVYNLPSFGHHNKTNLKSKYVDVFQDCSNNLRTNVVRVLECVTDCNRNNIFSTTLDIDSYFHIIGNDKINLRNLLDYANQKEFDTYKGCMTYEYLKSIYE